MKSDEIWDEIWTWTKYLAGDAKQFIFQLAAWGLGFIIIAFFAVKAFFGKIIKWIK